MIEIKNENEIKTAEIFVITEDIIEECVDDVIDKIENMEHKPC